MFLRDIIASDYKIFERMGDDNKKANIAVVQYVHMLSATTNARADTWNVLEIFGKGDGNALVTDKNEINKRFFGHMEKLKAEVPQELLAIESAIEAKIKEATKEIVNSQARQFRDKAEGARMSAEDYFEAAENKMYECIKYQNMLLSVQGKTNPILDDIRKVAASTFWKFNNFDGRVLTFVTRNPIVLLHKNPSAGIDINISMGTYRVTVDIYTMSPRVFTSNGNIIVDGYYHPHVNSSGSVCWGNVTTIITEHMKNYRLFDLMEILAANLSNYNSGNPYVSLERFSIKFDQMKKAGIQTTMGNILEDTPSTASSECEDCGYPTDECDCNAPLFEDEDSSPF